MIYTPRKMYVHSVALPVIALHNGTSIASHFSHQSQFIPALNDILRLPICGFKACGASL
jgi:hypothetical protein